MSVVQDYYRLKKFNVLEVAREGTREAAEVGSGDLHQIVT